ncbi:MAG: hypothetical protein JXO72_10645 [Vicinamibacteria bacterium]|nr:hypothetical protein [Vicinamibacteria bacterium]
MRILVAVMLVGMFSNRPTQAQEQNIIEDDNVRAQAAVTRETQARLRALLPDPVKLGARAAGAPIFYGENLWEYINGAAEAFHQYGFVALIHQEYRAGDVDVTLDIYDMGEPRNAFGVYVAERSSEAKIVEIGVEGHADDFTLCLFQGPYYVKIAGFRSGGAATPILLKLGKTVADTIGGARVFPEELALLPEESRVPRSESFVLTAPLGHAFLAPAFMARYACGGVETKLVISEGLGDEDALARRRQLESHFQKAGSLAPATIMEGAFLGTSSFEGQMLFMALGSRLVILTPPPDDPGKLIEAIRTSLKH